MQTTILLITRQVQKLIIIIFALDGRADSCAYINLHRTYYMYSTAASPSFGLDGSKNFVGGVENGQQHRLEEEVDGHSRVREHEDQVRKWGIELQKLFSSHFVKEKKEELKKYNI